MIISHAGEGCTVSTETAVANVLKGSGTILEAMRSGVPLVVVPDPELLHNHQAELAHQLSSVGYVLNGKLG